MPQYGSQLSVFFIFNFFTYHEENAAVISAFNDKITAQKYHKYRFCQAAAELNPTAVQQGCRWKYYRLLRAKIMLLIIQL
jgi:hypothetical protein